jgi:transglutaminase superfamily protein
MKIRLTLVSLLLVSITFAQPEKGVDYLAILKRSGGYNTREKQALPVFTYQSSNTPSLVALRKKYNLDSVAGFGNEESRLLNLLHWIHNTIRHDGQSESGISPVNANEVLMVTNKRKIGVSCGELATVLNDCYLAMGWSSRKIYCFPENISGKDHDSHVINIVYLSSKKKWIWVDPTNDAYVMNEKGELLSIEEVRQRLITGKPLIVNPDANWNHASSMTKDFYLDIYMAKNLYRLYCPLNSIYQEEATAKPVLVQLVPIAYNKEGRSKAGEVYYTSDPKAFWQLPGDE